uniref:uncharacterized protein LOC117605130 isoform X3 n=1 Tax=Osmia lignaria TaxID=473952 RepID=UPI0014795023|nr:uncharacterized protein LOC117605130 isoform X3 [Osmia lignaria]
MRQANMDVEAALLENSPTLSTISSDCTDTTYSGPGSPYSPESPIIVTSSYKKTKDDEVTPRPTPRHPLPPRKPNFRIRPPYLMICISIIEIAVHCLGDESTLRRWLVYDPRQRVQGWRFASYMLLHSNALHLALNVVIQLVLATPLENERDIGERKISMTAGGAGTNRCGDDLPRGRCLRSPRSIPVAAKFVPGRRVRRRLRAAYQPSRASLLVSRRVTVRRLASGGCAAVGQRGRRVPANSSPPRMRTRRMGCTRGRRSGRTSSRSGRVP